jgi:hypothetical protein
VTEVLTVTDSQTVTVTAPTTTESGTTTTIPTARHVLWGSSTPPQHTSSKETEARWIEDQIGRKLDITRHYVRAPGDWTGDSAGASLASGRSVMVTFTSGGDSWNQVANGSLDFYIKAQVAKVMPFGKRVWIAFENEPEAEGGKGSAGDYARAATHVFQVMDDAGYTGHETTAFMEYSWQSSSGRTPENWIPDGIDTLGVHVYFTRVGTCGVGVRSFASGVDDPYATATRFGLRMAIWEAGYSTKAGTSPELKVDFFRSIPAALEKFPRIDAITYWNQGSGKCADANSYYLDSSAAALRGFTDAGHTEILGG